MMFRRLSLALLITSLGCGDTAAPKPDATPTTTTKAETTTTAKPAETNAGGTATPTSEPTSDATASVSGEPSATPTAEPTKSGDPTASKTATPTATTTAAPTATAVASTPDVQGTETKEAAFSAYLSGAGKYKVGTPGTVTAVLNALGEYKVNKEYPIKFTLNAAPAGVSFGETVLRNANKAEKKATISIPFTPDSAGTHTISGVFSIGVCVASSCTNQKVPLSVAIKAE